MPEINLFNRDGKQIGSLPLPETVFGTKVNVPLIHQAVITEEANSRQGTADTKTRSEVRGGGRKPWRQKGTGRARQGSIRAPHWYHGGVVFGPHPRSYDKRMPKKMRRGAIRSALSAKVADGTVIGLDSMTLAAISTKEFAKVVSSLPLTREVNCKHWDGDQIMRGTKLVPTNVLMIVPEYDETLVKSCRNIPFVTLRFAAEFSARDVMVAQRIVLTQGAVARIEEALTK